MWKRKDLLIQSLTGGLIRTLCHALNCKEYLRSQIDFVLKIPAETTCNHFTTQTLPLDVQKKDMMSQELQENTTFLSTCAKLYLAQPQRTTVELQTCKETILADAHASCCGPPKKEMVLEGRIHRSNACLWIYDSPLTSPKSNRRLPHPAGPGDLHPGLLIKP